MSLSLLLCSWDMCRAASTHSQLQTSYHHAFFFLNTGSQVKAAVSLSLPRCRLRQAIALPYTWLLQMAASVGQYWVAVRMQKEARYHISLPEVLGGRAGHKSNNNNYNNNNNNYPALCSAKTDCSFMYPSVRLVFWLFPPSPSLLRGLCRQNPFIVEKKGGEKEGVLRLPTHAYAKANSSCEEKQQEGGKQMLKVPVQALPCLLTWK